MHPDSSGSGDLGYIIDYLEPEMIKESRPIYPPRALAEKWEGKVWVRVLVDRRGLVRAVEIAKGSGHRVLDQAARRAAWKNVFKPIESHGKPVPAWTKYSVVFTLPQ